jgi:hypothetical protein
MEGVTLGLLVFFFSFGVLHFLRRTFFLSFCFGLDF